MTAALVHATSEVWAQPAPPSRPLPPEVTAPLEQLLGYGVWIGTAVTVLSLIALGGLYWWVFVRGNPSTALLARAAWVLGAALGIGSAGAIAGFVLGS